MGKVSLKRRVLECLLFIFVPLFMVYVCVVYPVSVVSPEYYRRNVLPSYYAAVFVLAIFAVDTFFLAPRFLIRRCRSCGSEKMYYKFSFICGDCGHTFNPNRDLNENERCDFMAWAFGVPFSSMGVGLLLGSALAGVLNHDFVFLGVLGSVYVPLLTIVFWGLLKFFGKFAYVREQKHKRVVATMFFLMWGVLGILLLWGCATLIGMLI
jgi:hypothetical protein